MSFSAWTSKNPIGCAAARMSRKCAGLKPTPVHAGRFEALDICGLQLGVLPRNMRRAGRRAPHSRSGLDRFERAGALRGLYGLASSFCHVLPRVALIVGTRGARTGGAGAVRAVVVTLQCDAVAFVHV